MRSRRNSLALGIGLVFLLIASVVLTVFGLQVSPNSIVSYGDLIVYQPGNVAVSPANYNGFLKIAGSAAEKGYNTDGVREFNTQVGAKSVLLSAIPTTMVNGIKYREFILDVAEQAVAINLTELQFLTATSGSLTTYSTSPSPNIGGATTLVYSLDSAGDVTIELQELNNGGSAYDYVFYIPDTKFGAATACSFQGSGCTTYVYLI